MNTPLVSTIATSSLTSEVSVYFTQTGIVIGSIGLRLSKTSSGSYKEAWGAFPVVKSRPGKRFEKYEDALDYLVGRNAPFTREDFDARAVSTGSFGSPVCEDADGCWVFTWGHDASLDGFHAEVTAYNTNVVGSYDDLSQQAAEHL